MGNQICVNVSAKENSHDDSLEKHAPNPDRFPEVADSLSSLPCNINHIRHDLLSICKYPITKSWKRLTSIRLLLFTRTAFISWCQTKPTTKEDGRTDTLKDSAKSSLRINLISKDIFARWKQRAQSACLCSETDRIISEESYKTRETGKGNSSIKITAIRANGWITFLMAMRRKHLKMEIRLKAGLYKDNAAATGHIIGLKERSSNTKEYSNRICLGRREC